MREILTICGVYIGLAIFAAIVILGTIVNLYRDKTRF